MLSQEGLDWLGKMDAIIVHHDVLFAASVTPASRSQLREHRAKQGMVFVLTAGPAQLATDPVDQSCAIWLCVLTRGLNFALLPLLAPTAHDPWHQSEINLLLIVQVDFARTSTLLQLLQASILLLVLWVGAAHRKHRTLHAVPRSVQAAAHTAFAHLQVGVLFQGQRQQLCCPSRERISPVSGIAFNQFQ